MYDNNNNDITSLCTYSLDIALSSLTIDKDNKLFVNDGSKTGIYPRVVTVSYNGLTATTSLAVTVRPNS